MSKKDLQLKPVEQELTKEDLKKVSGGNQFTKGYKKIKKAIEGSFE